MKLIVNGDDLGLTRGVSLGIIDAMEKGIVSSTTALVNGSYFKEGIEEAKARGIKNIGIHLTLTYGRPVLPPEEVPSIVSKEGCFLKLGKKMDFNLEEIERELEAQIQVFLQSGLRPTHIDGHHHFYKYNRDVLDIVMGIAERYNIPLRSPDEQSRNCCRERGIKTTEAFSDEFYGENTTLEKLTEIILKHRDSESLEIMSHPAHVDEELMGITSYHTFREREYSILTSEEIRNILLQNNIQLIGFSEL